MTEIHFCDAREDDAAKLVYLMQAAFREYDDRLVPPSGVRRETVESVLEKMRQGGWIIAKSAADEPVGCVYYQPAPGWMYLGRLAVLPGWRGRGIAAALMDEVERRARARGLTRVRLGVRLVFTALRATYARRGYREVEWTAHPGFEQPTTVYMEKTL